MEMISKGAEANIYLQDDLIVKKRISKAYRVKELDLALRKSRTKKEAKLISLARRAGVPTPFIYDVDTKETTLKIAHVKGKQIKKILDTVSKKERGKICQEIGRCIGKMHSNHIIHGDLTTSNMIIKNENVFFIDFGLGEVNESIEAKGVDLLVFKKVLHSTHYRHEKECFESVVKGYSEEFEKKKEVLERLRVIERRGRYFSER